MGRELKLIDGIGGRKQGVSQLSGEPGFWSIVEISDVMRTRHRSSLPGTMGWWGFGLDEMLGLMGFFLKSCKCMRVISLGNIGDM